MDSFGAALQCRIRSFLKLSDLNETSISPKPVERQCVLTVLRVFSEKTYAALLQHPDMIHIAVIDIFIAIFINKVIIWWKILNVKAIGADTRHNDPLQAVINNPDDNRLNLILQFGDMALKMAGPKDHLEKEYSILRQGSGGTYFLSVQQVIEKLRIKHASLLLKLNVDIDNFNVKSGHQCALCDYKLSEDCCEILDNLQDLESFIADDVKMSLIHIAGYVTLNDKERTDYELLDQTTFYFQKYGQFSKFLDRGGLKFPTDNSCQWTFFCFVVFQIVKDHVCRKSLSSIFMIISDYYLLDMEEHHCVILSNIFFLNLCTTVTLANLAKNLH
ncbi:uncharacterized protein LOC124807936 [Hydra vulgaris]|uniref:uncharacterized protein LOC124807936 n=1 Tax=Hydra vulgaris TaxID=6087 RepID=UPI001F5F1586|nr:uncharacterized protein LOC124807936 [Hydra vulgaris]